MDTEILLKDFIKKEELSGCYKCKVGGDYVYNIIRSSVDEFIWILMDKM